MSVKYEKNHYQKIYSIFLLIQLFDLKTRVFKNILGLFLGYLTSETINTFTAFIKWLATRAIGVSAIAYMAQGTGQLLIIFLTDGLCWLLVKWHIVLLSFFSKHELDKQSGKNFENVLILKQNNEGGKSVAHIKLIFCFQHSTWLGFFLYVVRSPEYSFSPTFNTHPCIGHLKLNYCNAFFAFSM